MTHHGADVARRGRALLLCGLLGTGIATAGSVERVEVSTRSNLYTLELEAVVGASPQRTYAVLTDYAHLGKLNPAVKEVQILATPRTGVHTVRTLIQLCVWLFCTELDQVQDMEQVDASLLIATVQPAAGGFKRGRASWQFDPDGDQTRLRFRSELEPDFFVPPVVGPWLLRRMLRREAIVTVRGLEQRATRQP